MIAYSLHGHEVIKMLCNHCLKRNVCVDANRINELIKVLKFAEIEVKKCKEYIELKKEVRKK